MSQHPATRLPAGVKEDLTADSLAEQAPAKPADPTNPAPQDDRGEH